MTSGPQLKRNDRCSCGSGRKYKRCCLPKLEQTLQNESPEEDVSGAVLPGFLFLERLSETELREMVPRSLLKHGLRLFHDAAFEAFQVNRDPRQRLSISLECGKKEFFLTESRELSPNGKIATSCDCPNGGFNSVCEHQICLVFVIWSLFSPARAAKLSPSAQDRIHELARIFTDVRSGKVSSGRSRSAVTLEAVFFCPGLEFSSLDRTEEIEIVPASPDNRKAVFRDSPIRRNDQRGNYSDVFATSRTGREGSYYQGYQEREKVLRNALQFKFSDGTTLNASEILFHSYSREVPIPLLPWHDENDVPAWLIETSPYEPFSHQRADQTLTRVLFEAAEMLKSGRPTPAFFLCDSNNAQKERRAIRLRTVTATPPTAFKWTLDCTDKMSVRLGIPPEIATLRPNFGLTRNGDLFFHPLKRSLRTIDLHLKAEPLPSTQPDKPETALFRPRNTSFEETSVTIRDLASSLRTIPGTRFEIQPGSRVLSPNQWAPRLEIRDGNSIFFSAAPTDPSDSRAPTLIGLPASVFRSSLKILIAGIGATSGVENREIATRRKAKRATDLKILRHAGLSALAFRETISGLLDGRHPREIMRELDRKLYDFWIHLEKETPASPASEESQRKLSKICSGEVFLLFETLVSDCHKELENDRFPVYLPDGEIVFEGLARRGFEFLLAWIDQLSQETRGRCFEKTKSSAFDGLEPWLYGQVPLRTESSPLPASTPPLAVMPAEPPQFPLRALFPLAQKGFELFLDGEPIHEIAENDFAPLFQLAEPSGELDWFELDPRYFFRGEEIAIDQAQGLVRDGLIHFRGKIYVLKKEHLPSLRRLERFWERIRAGGARAKQGRGESRPIHRLPKSEALEMLALRASGIQVQGGPRWQKICEFYDSLGKRGNATIPLQGGTKAELKPYQKLGVQWLKDIYALNLGGILADDMGLGKTLQTLAFLEELRTSGELGPTLIIVPTSLTYNWTSEAERFTPELPIRIFQSREKDELTRYLRENPHAALICTYGLLTEHADFLAQWNWNIQVFDEAQNLKNLSAKRTTAARALPARFKLCLSGTPLENHLGEFFSLMDLVVPGCLGEPEEFRKKYVIPGQLAADDIEYLRLKSKPLVLRRTKSEILTELPLKTEAALKIPFESRQQRIYRDIAVSWNEKVREAIRNDGESKSQLMMLTALLRLRQACSDPSSIPNVKYDNDPPKLGMLRDALRGIIDSGESALVFTQFLHTFERIRRELDQAGIPVFCIHGGISRTERERALRTFNEFAGGAVMLMTLKAGGVGLNLTKASYVFHLEPWWNPAVENQATDRAHRIGQERPVQVYRYLIKDSVEEKIEVLKERKSARFNALFASASVAGAERETDLNAGGSLLSQSDFEYLLQ